jgi:hypothetical protein
MLLATGLVENPGRTHVIAAQGLLEDLRDGVLAVLDKDDPGELETHGRTKAYFDELSKDPDYVTPQNFLKPLLGDESMAEYMMLHAAARQMLLDRWPKSEMDTVMGSVSMPPDEESELQWLLEADTIENPNRLPKDLAAAALLPECVEVFSTAFPKTYDWLVLELKTRMIEKFAGGWRPEFWVEDALRIFMKMAFDAAVELSPEPDPPEAPEVSKKGFDSKSLKTPAQNSDFPATT